MHSIITSKTVLVPPFYKKRKGNIFKADVDNKKFEKLSNHYLVAKLIYLKTLPNCRRTIHIWNNLDNQN